MDPGAAVIVGNRRLVLRDVLDLLDDGQGACRPSRPIKVNSASCLGGTGTIFDFTNLFCQCLIAIAGFLGGTDDLLELRGGTHP